MPYTPAHGQPPHCYNHEDFPMRQALIAWRSWRDFKAYVAMVNEFERGKHS